MICAGCGRDVENGGIDKSSIFSDLNPENTGEVRVLRFCRGDEAGKDSCTDKVRALITVPQSAS